VSESLGRAPGGTPRALAIDAVLFDLDGTLADTAADLGGAVNRLRVDHGLDPLPLAALRPHASHGARGLLGAGFGVTPDDARYPALNAAFLAHYENALAIDTALFAGVDDILDAIERRGLRWGIVTNKATRFTEPVVAALKLAPRAGVVVCGDTVARAKPHPDPLLHAASALGVAPSRCVYVGDSERDVAAGVAAGMFTLVALYGYIGAHETPREWAADGHLSGIGELVDWLP
jgi:phosphoglycolate phosphatase